jgi:hypothetical protein
MSIVLVYVPSLLKNETTSPSPFESSTLLCIVFEASFPPPIPLDETKLGGQCLQPLDFMLELSC